MKTHNVLNYSKGSDNWIHYLEKIYKHEYKLNDKDKPQCLPGMLIAKGELNDAENIFYMKFIFYDLRLNIL